MSQSQLYLLLSLALLLPLVGAAALRALAGRLDQLQMAGAATLVFGVAIASVLTLSRSNAEALRIGGLLLLLPVATPVSDLIDLPTEGQPLPTRPPLPTPHPTRTPSPTFTPTATPPIRPTATLTA